MHWWIGAIGLWTVLACFTSKDRVTYPQSFLPSTAPLSTPDAHPCATPNIMKTLKSQLYIKHSTTESTGLGTKVSLVCKTFLLICHFYQATKYSEWSIMLRPYSSPRSRALHLVVMIKYIRCLQGDYKSEPQCKLPFEFDRSVWHWCVLWLRAENTYVWEIIPIHWYLADFNTECRTHYQMLMLKLRVIRSRVKSGSLNGMASPTNMREFLMFKVNFIRAKSELNERFWIRVASVCLSEKLGRFFENLRWYRKVFLANCSNKCISFSLQIFLCAFSNKIEKAFNSVN